MTSEQRFERDLPDLLADLYLGPTPDYRDDVLARTRRMRQRPAWTLPERWLPMRVVDRRRILAPNVPWRALAVIGLIGLLLAALLAAYVGGRQRLPAPFGPAANGAIVYAKDGDIYIKSGPSGPARLLIGGPTDDVAPLFSRQGDRFMFIRNTATTGDCECEVWVANADGSGAHKLAGGFTNASTWDWSPDGSKILVGYDVGSVTTIAVIPTGGGAPTTFKLPMSATSPEWRPPNGDQISFRGGDPNGAGSMYLINVDGSGRVQLRLTSQGIYPEHDFNHGYSWTADGRRLAYGTWDQVPGVADGGMRIHIAEVDAAGTVLSTRRVTFDATDYDEHQPVWLPTGDRMIFQTRVDADRYLSIGTVPSSSGAGQVSAKRIGGSSTNGDGIGFEIAPDGHSLLVLFYKEQTTFVYDLDTGVGTPTDLGPLDVSSYQRLAPPER